MPLWPVKVRLLDDESLSSWLARAALENGCDPLVLTASVWPNWRVWTTDIDRGIPPARQREIALVSGVGCALIQQASLSREAKLCSSAPLPIHGVWPWILGLGVRNRSYRGGIQFCPCCLAQDSKPYFRRQWRFSWVTGCAKHYVGLNESCEQCFRPIEPQRLEAINATALSLCASCGFDLRDSVTKPVLEGAMRFQLQAVRAMDVGAEEIWGRSLLAGQWFDTCRHLVTILRRSTLLPDSAMANALYKSGIDTRVFSPESLDLQFELLAVKPRQQLLACLYKLLNCLEIFAQNLKYQGAQSNSLMNRQGSLPPALMLLVDQLEGEERQLVESRKYKFGKPKSKVSVLKAWARLQRKYRIV